mmetsp:Transcript_7847/g.18294  ORF Transcript_7847/g.18294 Transcript_7847/m.18294 type:complete len:521 (+) Transcript_7847:105-1667(+)
MPGQPTNGLQVMDESTTKKSVTACVSEAIDGIGFGRFQIIALLLTGGIMFAEGAEMLVMGSVTTLLHDHWDLGPTMRGAMVSIVFIGFSVGNFVSGQIGDRWGRRKAILLGYLLIGVCGFATACSTSPFMMISLRFLVGLGCGIGFPAVYSLIPEVCPSHIRGSICTLMIGFMPLGEVYAASGVLLLDPTLTGDTDHCDSGKYYPSYGLVNPDHCTWKALCEYSAIPALVFFLVSYLSLPESPHFLAEQRRYEELEDVLKHMAKVNGKGLDLAPLQACYASGPKILTSTIEDAGSSSYSFVSVVATLLSSRFLSTTLFLCLAHFVKDFSVFGLAYALPQYFRFMEHLTVGLQLVVMASLAIPGVLLSILLTRSQAVGHILCMSCSAAISSAFTLGMLEFVHDWMSTVSAYVVKAVALTYFIVTVVYTTEVFPTSMRNTAVGLCTCAGRMGSILAPLLFELSLHHGDSTDAFMWMLFALMGVVACAAPWCLTYETKGKALASSDDSLLDASASKYGATGSA